MKEKDKNSSRKSNKDARGETKKHRSRRIMPLEERTKRGRWLIILVLVLTLLFGYAFWR